MTYNNIEENMLAAHTYPGAFLAAERQKRGITIEQVANRLNLRTQIIAHLEADEYEQLPEAVFVQGYIRGYCKYLAIQSDDLIVAYGQLRPQENKSERYLFQNPSSSKHRGEKMLHWLTAGFVLVAAVSISIWLYQERTVEKPLKNMWRQADIQSEPKLKINNIAQNMDTKLTEVSKMKELLTASIDNVGYSPKEMESVGE
jgi:cytoskeleton protein RodZ